MFVCMCTHKIVRHSIETCLQEGTEVNGNLLFTVYLFITFEFYYHIHDLSMKNIRLTFKSLKVQI